MSTSSALAVAITEFELPPESKPDYITRGSEGNMWFTDPGTNSVGRITMSGQVAEYTLGITPKADLSGIAAGPEGDLWFTERKGKQLGRITPSGIITQISTGLTKSPDIYGITAGPNGEMWFTETSNARIGAIDPLTGTITELPVPAAVYTNIVTGPEGDLWFTSPSKGTIDRMTTAGEVSTFGPLPASDCATGAKSPCPYPQAIVVGPEGNLWFDEYFGDAIGRITPTGSISEYTNGLTLSAGVADLAVGAEGDIWFTEEKEAQVGSISPTGVITEFGGLAAEGAPLGITLGPDGNLWVTESDAGKIARIIPDVPPVVATGGASGVSTGSATLTGTVRSRGADTHYVFEYGATTAYGQATPAQDNGAGDETNAIGAALGGLSPGTVYHYRLVASNAYGTSYGADMTFATAPPPPPPPRVTVGAFEMYFRAAGVGKARLRLSEIVVIGLRRGLRVSYACRGCKGARTKQTAHATGKTVKFKANGLVVGGKSVLKITVVAPDGSRRLRWYGFHVSGAESYLRHERCYLRGSATATSCPGGSGKSSHTRPGKHTTKAKSHRKKKKKAHGKSKSGSKSKGKNGGKGKSGQGQHAQTHRSHHSKSAG